MFQSLLILFQVKESLLKSKEEIIVCIAGNIRDQIDPDSLVAHMGAFNLETADTLEDCKNHIEQLYDVFGVDSKHEMQKW